jgi:RNA polymerase sigma-70 factor (ECF subfamily)
MNDPWGKQQFHTGFRATTQQDVSPRTARAVDLAIGRAKAGDREAVRFLYIQYADNVYGYVRSIVRDPYEAEDLTQQVFAKLIFAITKYEDRGVAFLAWLLRLSRNVALDHLRARRVILAAGDGSLPVSEEVEAHESDEAARDNARNLSAAIDALPEEQRSVVIMRHVVGLTPREIADRLGRSESSIHGLHHRGRRALLVELERLGSAPAVTMRRRQMTATKAASGAPQATV